jgi:RHS repeat-associated protein
MEADGEVSGNGNSYTTEFRQYDPRLGRWKSLDPLMRKYPSYSPFNAMLNNPVVFTDPDGDEVILRWWKRKDRKKLVSELERTTGLVLHVNIFGKLTYETDVNGDPLDNDRSDITRARPLSRIGRDRLIDMIDDRCNSVHVSGRRGKGSRVLIGYGDAYENARGQYVTKANIDPKQIEDLNDNGQGTKSRDMRRTTGLGMVFFHEGDHIFTDSKDEWQLANDTHSEDDLKSGGILPGSATDFTNSIREESNLPVRLTYSMQNANGDLVVPYGRHGSSFEQKMNILRQYSDGKPPSGATYQKQKGGSDEGHSDGKTKSRNPRYL